MATKCRAKEPHNCRVHGNPTVSQLQEQADKAAVAGNMTEYFELREKIDAALDEVALEKEPAFVSKYPLDDETLAAGENAWYDAVNEWHVFTDSDMSWEESKMMTRGIKHTVKRALQAADEHMPDGKITPTAIQAAANKFFDVTYEGTDPNGAKPDSAYFRSIAKEVLEATREKPEPQKAPPKPKQEPQKAPPKPKNPAASTNYSEETIDAGVSAWREAVEDWQTMTLSPSDDDSEWHGGNSALVGKVLDAASPHMSNGKNNPTAEAAAAQVIFDAHYEGRTPPEHATPDSSYYRSIAQRVIKAANQ